MKTCLMLRRRMLFCDKMLQCFVAWYVIRHLCATQEIIQDGDDNDRSPYETDIPVPTQAVIGGRMSLPCDVTSPLLDDEVYLVLWYKDDSATPIYSLDARKGRLGQARHAASEGLSGRAYFSSVPQPAVLQVDKVSVADEGIYRCRVDFQKARTQHSALIVTVIIPPSIPIIKDYNGKVLNGTIGPFNEGESLHLICQAEGGKPPPSLTWWRGRKSIDDSYEYLSDHVTRNELLLAKLQRRDLNVKITCQAANNGMSPPLEASVTLEVNFRPSSVHLKGKRRRFSSKRPAQFECESRGSRPAAVITWRKGSTRLHNATSKVTAQGNATSSALELALTSDDHGKFLYCQAENPEIPGSALEDGVKLEVHYVPQLNLRLGGKLSPHGIQEGSDVHLECNIRANPWVTETGWRYEGRELATNQSGNLVVSNQSLVLQRIRRSNRGRYSCTATNVEGQGESNQLYLRVQYSPICKVEQDVLYGAVPRRTVQVVCEVEADPENVIFHWSSNVTSGNAGPTFTSGMRSVMNYTPNWDSDFGTIFCFGRNSVGYQERPCTFIIAPIDPPDPVSNCSVVERTETSFRVTCSDHRPRAAEGADHFFFFVEVRERGTEALVQNVSGQTADFTVAGLTPGATYKVSLFCSSESGQSKAKILHVVTMSSPDSQTQREEGEESDLSFILFIVSATAGSIVLVGLILFIAAKFYVTRRSPKNSSMSGENEKSSQSGEKSSGDGNSEGCNFSIREEEKVRENIPDVVIFSEKAKPEEEIELCSSYSPEATSYWKGVELPSITKGESDASQVKLAQSNPPWCTSDWVMPPQAVEIVALHFQRDDGKGAQRRASTADDSGAAPRPSSHLSASRQTATAKQTDV